MWIYWTHKTRTHTQNTHPDLTAICLFIKVKCKPAQMHVIRMNFEWKLNMENGTLCTPVFVYCSWRICLVLVEWTHTGFLSISSEFSCYNELFAMETQSFSWCVQFAMKSDISDLNHSRFYNSILFSKKKLVQMIGISFKYSLEYEQQKIYDYCNGLVFFCHIMYIFNPKFEQYAKNRVFKILEIINFFQIF